MAHSRPQARTKVVDSILIPENGLGVRLVHLTSTECPSTDVAGTSIVGHSTWQPHVEDYLDVEVGVPGPGGTWQPQAIAKLTGMKRFFTNPYVVFYVLASEGRRENEYVRAERAKRSSAGTANQPQDSWRGSLLVVKYTSEPFSEPLDVRPSPFVLRRLSL